MSEPSTAATAAVFERLAGRYDAWYDGPVGRVLFPPKSTVWHHF